MPAFSPSTTEQHFASAVRSAAASVPAGLAAHTGRVPDRRLGVYRNNVAYGLRRALAQRFPVVERIVGEEFFAAAAGSFVSQRLPASPVLSEYGDDFPDFLAGFAPAADLDYLADVARLEALRTRAYHAADDDGLGPEAFAALDPQRLAFLRVELHPSLAVLASQHPIVTIWAMNAGEMDLGSIDGLAGEDALIARPALDVIVRRLPAGAPAFLTALQAGEALGDAAAAASDAAAAFDLTQSLAVLIGDRLIVRIHDDLPSIRPRKEM